MFKGLLAGLVKKYAVKHGEFTLASGKKSSYYLDLKAAYTRPEVMKEILFGLEENLKGYRFDRVAGMELGAVPLAVAMSTSTQIPFVIIRKKDKGHGSGNRIEGEILNGEQILLVEDVVTTGGSISEAVRVIRDAGGVCTRAIAVVDRLEGGGENLQKINITLTSLLTIKDLGL